MKSLHCCCDAKFIMGMISLFESDKTVNNDYIVVTDNNELKFVDPNIVSIVHPKDLLQLCLGYDAIFIHYLKAHFWDIIPLIPSRIKVIWFGWGADMYDGKTAIIKGNYYGNITEKYYNKEFGGHLNTIIRKIVFFFNQEYKRNRSLRRIDYFSGVFPYEYDLLRSHFKGLHALPLDFYYGSINFFIPEEPLTSFDSDKKNVILGNSAAYTNNHLDALLELKNSGWDSIGGKVIVPLSYGGNRKYINEVITLGKQLFGEFFSPLMDYMPLNDYLRLISSCKTAVFYHKRQQASDNVFMQMMYGARVFMSRDNLMYSYLKELGYKVFSLEDDSNLINVGMTKDEVLWNRRLLSDNYSASKLIERVKRINSEIARNL